ncbi:MAG TPA: hypothetical protein VL051_10470, partial [Burkholderiaceae bacterium]|nr:hypothetical protein [Burkholderiaceae bacterium]
LLEDSFCNKYIHELVCWASQQSDVEISQLVIFKPPPISFLKKMDRLGEGNGFGYLGSVLLFRTILMIEKLILKFSSLHRAHFDTFDLSKTISKKITIESELSESGSVYQFSPVEARRVKALGLDLLIAFGVEHMHGEILNASRLGVISITSSGNKLHRGWPPGFWECYYRHPKTGFIIQRLTGEKIRNVLVSGYFSTKFLFSLNQANLYSKIGPHLKQLLKDVAVHERLPEMEIHQPYSGVVRDFPTVLQSIRYLFKIAGRIGKRTLFRVASYQKKWEISFISSGWEKAVLWDSIKAKAPRGHFWADPFVYAYGGKTYCFVEDYVYKTDRAHISVLEVGEAGVHQVGECIREPFHLSFPFLFNYGGQLYMCPECSGSRQIRIYRCAEFPLQWELVSVAIDEVSAVDTMIFEYAGTWWMLTSIDKSESNDYCSELYLFSASSPLSKEWKAHPRNPIRIDSEGGRNAGMLFQDGKIFRMAQRQGYDQYGQGLLMYGITELSDTAYSERLVSEINPYFKKGLLGVHHLSSTGEVTVFDHVSRSFVL